MAVWRDNIAVGRAGTDPRSHAERLPLEAVDWLAAQGLTLTDVDAFIVIAGPGSFTGLRVGLSAVQGWAFATGRQVAAVPTLDALVASLPADVTDGRVVVPCVDGLRGEVFYGAWRDGVPLLGAEVGRPDDVIVAVRDVADDAPVVVAGDGAEKYAAQWTAAGWVSAQPVMTLAEAAAGLVAAGRFTAGPPHAARAMYVRRTDAELMRERGGRRL